MRDQDVYAVELTGNLFCNHVVNVSLVALEIRGNTGLKAFEEGEKSDHYAKFFAMALMHGSNVQLFTCFDHENAERTFDTQMV